MEKKGKGDVKCYIPIDLNFMILTYFQNTILSPNSVPINRLYLNVKEFHHPAVSMIDNNFDKLMAFTI